MIYGVRAYFKDIAHLDKLFTGKVSIIKSDNDNKSLFLKRDKAKIVAV